MSADLHTLLPQAPAAELALLGALVIDTHRVMQLCEERAVRSDWFHIPHHQLFFEHIAALHAEKKNVEFVTLGQRLTDAGQIDQVGGMAGVSDLFTHQPTAANAAQHLGIVEEKHTLRRVRALCIATAAACDSPGVTAAELLDGFQANACAINRPGAELTGTATSIGQGLMEAVEAIEKAYENRGKITGIPTGLAKLDDMIMGFAGPQFILTAGRPGMGKSAMLLNIAESAARAGFGALVYTLEMSVQELCQRFLGSVAEVNLQRFKDGFLSERDFTRIHAAVQPSMNLPMWLHAAPALSIQDLRAHARAFKRSHPNVGAIFVDYVQLMRSTTRRAESSRAQELSEITGGMKRLAMELQIPVIAGAQLNRDAEEGRAPKLSHLRESGSLEQDADIVILLHRPGYHEEDGDPTEATAIIAKHRNGAVGPVPLRFIGEHTRFLDADPEKTGDQRRTNESRKKQAAQREFKDHARDEK